MKRVVWLLLFLVLIACRERSTPARGSSGIAGDSAPVVADTIMARDTAQPVTREP